MEARDMVVVEKWSRHIIVTWLDYKRLRCGMRLRAEVEVEEEAGRWN